MKILKQQKQLLCDFWDYFSENKEATGNRLRREALKYSYRTKEEKLQKLIEYSKINLSFSNQKSMSNRRIDFNYQKHTLVKMNIGIHLLLFCL
jgi:very-short-patch-repair endonuclease